jgi:hypothetical protein
VKTCANGEGFLTLEGWLGPNDLLILKRDCQAPMVVLTFEMYARLQRAALLEPRVSPNVILQDISDP